MNIRPVNGHLLIEPIQHEEFIATDRNTYQEIGVVLERSAGMMDYSEEGAPKWLISIGDKVYFDAWLAKKYPKEGGRPDEFLWLVKWEDVTAVEYAE